MHGDVYLQLEAFSGERWVLMRIKRLESFYQIVQFIEENYYNNVQFCISGLYKQFWDNWSFRRHSGCDIIRGYRIGDGIVGE